MAGPEVKTYLGKGFWPVIHMKLDILNITILILDTNNKKLKICVTSKSLEYLDLLASTAIVCIVCILLYY